MTLEKFLLRVNLLLGFAIELTNYCGKATKSKTSSP